jgi:hypothetical protein
MTGAYQLEEHRRVVRMIEALPQGSQILERVTVLPEGEGGYSDGVNPLWDHVLEGFPHLRDSADVRHQFAVFGGYVATPGPFAITFLQRFLQDSQF